MPNLSRKIQEKAGKIVGLAVDFSGSRGLKLGRKANAHLSLFKTRHYEVNHKEFYPEFELQPSILKAD